MGLTSFQSGFVCGFGAIAVLIYPVRELYKRYIGRRPIAAVPSRFEPLIPYKMGIRQSSSSKKLQQVLGSLRESVQISCICTESLKDKVVVITSVSDNTGYQLALQCVMGGAKVIMGCANDDIVKEITADIAISAGPNTITRTVLLDLQNFKSCVDFADDLLRLESRIDFLVVTTVEFGRQVNRAWKRRDFNPVWKTNYFGCVILIEKLRTKFTGDGDKGILLISSEDLSEVEFYNLNLIDVLARRCSNRRLDSVDYKNAKYALWIYCINLVNKVAHMDKISFTAIHSNGVTKTGFDLINGYSKTILCKRTIETPAEYSETILHCMKNPRIKKRCMISKYKMYKATVADLLMYSALVGMCNNLLTEVLQ